MARSCAAIISTAVASAAFAADRVYADGPFNFSPFSTSQPPAPPAAAATSPAPAAAEESRHRNDNPNPRNTAAGFDPEALERGAQAVQKINSSPDPKKIIFRDLKTSNILLDEHWNAKLSDFGLARQEPTEGLSHVSTAAAFRALVGFGYQTLQSVLLDFCKWQPSEGLLNALFDMLVDGKYNTNAVIKNEDVIILLCNVLKKSSILLQHYGLDIFLSLGRGGTMLMHQILSVEGSHPGGLSTAPKNQVSEKHPIQQSQGFFPSSSVLNTPLPHSANQPKMYPRPLPQTSKQMSLMPSMSDNINQGSTQLPPGHTLVASHQPPVSASLPLTSQPQQRQANQSQQKMQRLTLHQNRQINSDSRMQSSTDQIYANQMIPDTSSPQCADSSAPVVSTGMQWKPEPSYDISQPIQTSHLAGSPQENMIGTEALMSSSNQGLGQRQFSGSLPLHKHNIGGQWQQQPQPQQQQSQLQHRQGGAPGNLYARPSNSGAG